MPRRSAFRWRSPSRPPSRAPICIPSCSASRRARVWTQPAVRIAPPRPRRPSHERVSRDERSLVMKRFHLHGLRAGGLLGLALLVLGLSAGAGAQTGGGYDLTWSTVD